ncbi:BTAD domain-containing putative transcriptional regulator [Actinoplanes sp. CA-051413]|uniref:AfsR/SARP family transcriptional regulator n=1 Tax=Actinoplanes sp. CA-051413 TaxID=3239899 RepID=UPI003D9639FA
MDALHGGSVMEFRLLGPVELWHRGERVELGPARQRCVLVALLLDGQRPVPTATLVSRVWGDDPPARARDVLYTYVARLRSTLRGVGVQLHHRAGAYTVEVPADAIDVLRFTATVERARQAPALSTRLDLLREALGLWRGVAFDGLSSGWIERCRERLERRWLGALVDRFELELALGRHAAVIDELSELVSRQPTAEPLAGQLMLALHRAGRKTEALEVFRAARARLIADFGLEPGADLQHLEQAILRDDPAVAAPARPPPPAPVRLRAVAARPVPAQLPAAPKDFVGRDDELRTLGRSCRAGVAAASPVVITGPAGVGKTALALRWCWSVQDQFPDGHIYVDLHGFGDEPPMTVTAVIDRVMRALDVPAAQAAHDPEEAAADLRSQLAGRKVLLLFDNAATAQQIRPLMPGGGSCLVVVTSRSRLDGLVAVQNAFRLVLAPLAHRDAKALVESISGPVVADRATLDRLVDLCDRLPLALRVVAARLGDAIGADALVRELEDEEVRLGVLAIDDVSIRRALAASIRSLDAATCRMLALLGVHPGRLPAFDSCAALADLSAAEVRASLDGLTAVHLVHRTEDGRYRMHDLVRLVARDLAARLLEAPDAAMRRLLVWYRDMANAADRVLRPAERPNFASPPEPVRFADADTAMEWLDGEADNLLAAAERACASQPDLGWQIAAALYGWLVRRRHVRRWITLYTAAAQAASRAGDRPGEAMITSRLAIPFSLLDQHDDAAACCRRAYELRLDLGDTLGAATALVNLGAVYNNAGRPADAIGRLGEAGQLAESLPAAGHLRALIQSNLGEAQELAGRYEAAVEHYSRALAIARDHCAARDVAEILLRLAGAHRSGNRPAEALGPAEHAVATAEQARDDLLEIEALEASAWARTVLGDLDAAAGHLRRQLALCEAVDHQGTDQVREALAALDAR